MTEKEDLIIKRYYPKEGREVAKRLDGRSKESCVNRASTLKVKYKGKWSIEQDIILLTYYGVEKEKCFERLPDFSIEECRKHVLSLHL